MDKTLLLPLSWQCGSGSKQKCEKTKKKGEIPRGKIKVEVEKQNPPGFDELAK